MTHTTAPPRKSIHACPLRACGGVIARVGFSFQDHVAVSFCIEMREDGSTLLSVWCEGQDDITLTPVEGCHFPGFTALDFQAKLEDGSPGITRDKENFVLRPFIKLLGSEGMDHTQMIVAGSAFEGLEGVNRIPLTTIWKASTS